MLCIVSHLSLSQPRDPPIPHIGPGPSIGLRHGPIGRTAGESSQALNGVEVEGRELMHMGHLSRGRKYRAPVAVWAIIRAGHLSGTPIAHARPLGAEPASIAPTFESPRNWFAHLEQVRRVGEERRVQRRLPNSKGALMKACGEEDSNQKRRGIAIGRERRSPSRLRPRVRIDLKGGIAEMPFRSRRGLFTPIPARLITTMNFVVAPCSCGARIRGWGAHARTAGLTRCSTGPKSRSHRPILDLARHENAALKLTLPYL
jgi:hypothetical protein